MISNKTTTVTYITLNELIKSLSKEDVSSYNSIIHSVNIPLEDYIKYTSWSKDKYTRNCIVSNDKFELVLLCWEKAQITPIHDHDGEECWVKVINGVFREKIYKENREGVISEIKSITFKNNEVTYMKDFMGYHSLENLSKERAMSLHLYAKPIKKCKTFNQETKSFTTKKLTYCN